MSHVFISYKREDADKRDSLVAALKTANIPYWYDKNIEYGEDWFNDINQNLERAYAVLVIVTEKSLDSHHVTYEWSWAVGHGLEVFTLQFGDIRSDQEKHPLRIMRTQGEIYNGEIPEKIIQKLIDIQVESPVVRYINLRLNDITMQLRILAAFSLWLYPYERSKQVDFETVHSLIERTSREAEKIYYEELPKFWLSSAHAFSVKNRKLYKELDYQMHDFGLKLAQLATAIFNSNNLRDMSEEIKTVDKFRREIMEPIFSQFTVRDWRLEAIIAFNSLLQDLSANTLQARDSVYKLTIPMMTHSLLKNYLMDKDAEVIWGIIKNLAGSNLYF